jgi:hypothetical protein
MEAMEMMMTIDFDTIDYMAQLRRSGLRPSEKLVQRILGLGAAAVAPLLELATDRAALYNAPPTGWAGVHALRLLGEVGSASIVEPLLRAGTMNSGETEEGSAPELWDSELPQILARLGAAIIPQLWAFADDDTNLLDGRSTALITLSYITTVAPETQDEIVAGLRERLSATDDPLLAGYVLIALGNIGAPDAYAEVMALYKAGRIDRALIGPATARQLLLSKGEKRLACAKHPLWERYDQHGPFARQPNQ